MYFYKIAELLLELNQAFKGLGFSDEQLEQLKATEPKTFKRISKLSEEAKRLIEDAKKSTGNDSKLKEEQEEYKLVVAENEDAIEKKTKRLAILKQKIAVAPDNTTNNTKEKEVGLYI